MSEVQEWFKAGTAALQIGNKAEAEALLLRVVEANEEHEQAWLWLSGAVQTDEDQRICLENVLSLNPDSAAAKRGLKAVMARLEADGKLDQESEDDEEEEEVEYEDIPSLNLAAQLLYPDSHRRKRIKRKAVESTKDLTTFAAVSTFDDIWSRGDEICAYCAHQIDVDDRECPRCKRNLMYKQFRYDTESAHLHIFWVILLGSGQLFMLQAILGMAQGRIGVAAIVDFILMGVYMVVAYAVYKRQLWAYLTSIYLTGAILVAALLNRIIFASYSVVPNAGLADGELFISAIAISGMQLLLYVMLIGTLGLVLVYALFFVSSDFVCDEKRQTAVRQSGVNAADRYDAIARAHAKEGRWATAVLHWQPAAAKAPSTITYQRRLANAYARLGHYERSLSVLNGAIKISGSVEMKEKLEKMKTSVLRANEQAKKRRSQKQADSAHPQTTT